MSSLIPLSSAKEPGIRGGGGSPSPPVHLIVAIYLLIICYIIGSASLGSRQSSSSSKPCPVLWLSLLCHYSSIPSYLPPLSQRACSSDKDVASKLSLCEELEFLLKYAHVCYDKSAAGEKGGRGGGSSSFRESCWTHHSKWIVKWKGVAHILNISSEVRNTQCTLDILYWKIHSRRPSDSAGREVSTFVYTLRNHIQSNYTSKWELPFELAEWVSTLLFSTISDTLIKKGWGGLSEELVLNLAETQTFDFRFVRFPTNLVILFSHMPLYFVDLWCGDYPVERVNYHKRRSESRPV